VVRNWQMGNKSPTPRRDDSPQVRQRLNLPPAPCD
jgi:hypothetical protein